MPLANRDVRESVQESTHGLRRGLRGRVADAAGNDHGAAAGPAAQSRAAEELREPGEQPDGGRRAEGGLVVLVHLIAETRVADLVESHELIEPVRPPVRQHEPIKGDGEACLAVRLDRFRLAEHA